MQSLSFQQLPLVAKLAVGVVFYNAWWPIEELIIDRHGLWRYMPYYKVAYPCVWDLAVGLVHWVRDLACLPPAGLERAGY
jgi:hypothetical protein